MRDLRTGRRNFLFAAGAAALGVVAAACGGDPPEAARFDRFIVTSWAGKGFLTDLTAKAQSDKVTQDKFIKEGWDEATYKSKLYAVPFDTDLRALYYNKKHFQEA